MLDSLQPVGVALIAVIAAAWAARPALKDIGLKRRLETTKAFSELVALASNAGTKGAGLSEQIAAIHLIGSFGRDERHLRDAARAALESIQQQEFGGGESASALHGAARHALTILKTRKWPRSWRT